MKYLLTMKAIKISMDRGQIQKCREIVLEWAHGYSNIEQTKLWNAYYKRAREILTYTYPENKC